MHDETRVQAWKRLLIGNTFGLQSRSPDFYRDVFLLCPFIWFTIAFVGSLSGPAHDYRFSMELGGLSALALLLARERLLLISGCLGFVCLESLSSSVLRNDPRAFVVSLVSGALFLVAFRRLKDYKPSYSVTGGLTVATLLVGILSLSLTLAIFHFLR